MEFEGIFGTLKNHLWNKKNDTVQDVLSFFPPVRRLSPPPQIEPLPQQSLMQVPRLRHKQVTHLPRQKGNGIIGIMFLPRWFFHSSHSSPFQSLSPIVTNCLQSTRLEGDMQFQLIASTKSTLSSEEIHLQKRHLVSLKLFTTNNTTSSSPRLPEVAADTQRPFAGAKCINPSLPSVKRSFRDAVFQQIWMTLSCNISSKYV